MADNDVYPRCEARDPRRDWYAITKLALDRGKPIRCDLATGHEGPHRRYCIMDRENPADRWES